MADVGHDSITNTTAQRVIGGVWVIRSVMVLGWDRPDSNLMNSMWMPQASFPKKEGILRHYHDP